jgi:SAM-dependent methyltransferase
MSDDIKAQAQARFGEYAQGYVTSATHAKGAELERLVQMAQPQPTWRMLDIATGGGHTALKFAPLVQEVVAYDYATPMLDAARQFIEGQGVTNVAYVQGDAENLPFEDAEFDFVTNRIAAHHFPDVFKFAQGCYRILKPGGTLLIQDQVVPDNERDAFYVNSFEKLRDPSHVRALPGYEWNGTLLDAGFAVEETEVIIKRHELLHWAKMQGSTPEVIERLQVLLLQAPPRVVAWMLPEYAGTDFATFCNRHILIVAKKPNA